MRGYILNRGKKNPEGSSHLKFILIMNTHKPKVTNSSAFEHLRRGGRQ